MSGLRSSSDIDASVGEYEVANGNGCWLGGSVDWVLGPWELVKDVYIDICELDGPAMGCWVIASSTNVTMDAKTVEEGVEVE